MRQNCDGFFFRFAPPLVAAIVAWLLGSGNLKFARERLFDRVLNHFDIKTDLGNSHSIKQLVIRMFDPEYYSKLDIIKVIERAMEGEGPVPNEDRTSHPKRIGDYSQGEPKIQVAVMAADIARRGQIVTISENAYVVDAILAATAVTPLFQPPDEIEVDDGLKTRHTRCIDATNISNEPTFALIEFFRNRLDDKAKPPLVYPVSTLPLSSSKERLPQEPESANSDLTNLVNVAFRALQLSQFQNATFERSLVNLYSRLVPEGQAILRLDNPVPQTYVGVHLLPIEPSRPVNTNLRLIMARTSQERRRLIREAAAQGCRAALESMIPHAIRQVAEANPKLVRPVPLADGTKQQYVSCRAVIERRLHSDGASSPGPDSHQQFVPGVAEICRECYVRNGAGPEDVVDARAGGSQRTREVSRVAQRRRRRGSFSRRRSPARPAAGAETGISARCQSHREPVAQRRRVSRSVSSRCHECHFRAEPPPFSHCRSFGRFHHGGDGGQCLCQRRASISSGSNRQERGRFPLFGPPADHRSLGRFRGACRPQGRGRKILALRLRHGIPTVRSAPFTLVSAMAPSSRRDRTALLPRSV